MPKFAANLTMMFNEVPFLERFAQAAQAGFSAVEYLFPYAFSPDEVAECLAANNLTQALFNMPPGDWERGERGMASLAGREAEFRESVATALRYAKATGVKRLHMMAGLGSKSDIQALQRYKDAIHYAAEKTGAEGIDLLLEPLNRRDMPGYLLDDYDFAADLITGLNLPNVKLQFDIYHCQILHGDITMRMRRYWPLIGHVQIASIPSRNEPNAEELNDEFLLNELDRLGYAGFVGCEYRPKAGTLAGLGWFNAWKASQ